MEFNDGSQYRILSSPSVALESGREVYVYRGASMREGMMYVDTAFEHHRKVSTIFRATCIYQFVWPNYTPEAQALFLVNKVLGGGLQTNEMVMLDIEDQAQIPEPVDFLRRWCAVVESMLDTRAWIYVPGPLSSKLTRQVTGDRIVMAPKYSRTGRPGPEPTWSHDVHQYCDRGFFPGCGLTGDINTTELTVPQMLALCNPNGIPEQPCRS